MKFAAYNSMDEPQKQRVCVCVCVRAHMLSHVQLFAIPWTVAHQVPLFMGFSRQEY